MGEYDLMFISPGLEATMPQAHFERIPQQVALPWIGFRAYHPDLVYVQSGSTRLKGPADDYHSGIALAAYRLGMCVKDTIRLFNGETFQTCGLMDWWPAEWTRLNEHLSAIDLDLRRESLIWGRREAFMYSNNHPKIGVVFDIATALLRKIGREPLDGATIPHDNLAFASGFAVYPEVGEALGVPGNYVFKTYDTYRQFGLEEFIASCFAVYDQYPREFLNVIPEFRPDFQKTELAVKAIIGYL
jgi:hypothetical protein